MVATRMDLTYYPGQNVLAARELYVVFSSPKETCLISVGLTRKYFGALKSRTL